MMEAFEQSFFKADPADLAKENTTVLRPRSRPELGVLQHWNTSVRHYT